MAISTRAAESAGRSLVSIAMLKVKYDHKHQDYLDYLRPYVGHVLPKKGERVHPDRVATDVASEFGLRVPVQVIERLLARYLKQGALTRVDGALYVKEVARDEHLEQRRARAVQEITSVVECFKRHCSSRFELEISDESAAVALTGFIRRFAVDCLRSFTLSSALPPVPSSEASDTWVASFINNAAQEGLQLWSEVSTLFRSVLLANAFTCPDPDLATSKFRGLSLFLDTPLVLSLVGLHGEYDRRKTLELIKQVKGLEGSFFVFDHTLEETRSVLKYVEAHLEDSDQSNRAIRQLRQEGKKRSDVVLLAASLEQELKEHGVRVRVTPPYDERYQIDEAALEGCLDEDIGHMNERALLHDINSVRSIYVLRSGSAPRRLEDAKAAFVTTNYNFAKAADSYSKRFEFGREVSPVVTDFSLANICWLKRPSQADELITLELLASTEAALSPSAGEWKAFLEECEKLRKSGRITADQEILVRESLVAKDDLVTLTKGAGTSFSSDVAIELIRRAEERIAEPLKFQVQDANRRRESLENQLLIEGKRAEALRNRQQLMLERIAGLAAGSVAIALATILFYGVWLGVDAALDGTPLSSLGYFGQAVGYVAPIIVVLLGLTGWSTRDIHQRMKQALSRWLVRKFHIGEDVVPAA